MKYTVQALALLCALLVFASLGAASTNLTPGQNVTIAAAGKDAGGNNATIGAPSCAVDDHALAYCAVKSGGEIWVVSRGPVGTFHVTVTADNAAAQPITATVEFVVVAPAGPPLAASITLTVSAPFATWAATPPIPAGW